ncbi:J domain-containing protein [Magnetospirillum sp. UT-4]|uniref:J domain-containing protein n=1 Tax=Magnetospirillum sp. UT-4 TaxID=2681467 RepID=UPI00137CDD4D|nr:J domain-containing protein [Magnetospirillum sp. UT-4]CAA7618714.1 DnaJ-class molecular chaperone [Magnetospirillum sp. UT-4]
MKASGTKRSWRVAYAPAEPSAATRACDHPGCTHEGEYRAPRSRDNLNEYYWFCLDHVRAYNSAWDYYKGMTPEQIEDEIRTSTTWQRPTWPLGSKTGNRRFSFSIHDPLGVFAEEAEEMAKAKTRPPTPEEEAMTVLELVPPVTVKALKARYKQLVKQHHPDANNGDKDAEERFKDISRAYTILLNSLTA